MHRVLRVRRKITRQTSSCFLARTHFLVWHRQHYLMYYQLCAISYRIISSRKNQRMNCLEFSSCLIKTPTLDCLQFSSRLITFYTTFVFRCSCVCKQKQASINIAFMFLCLKLHQ
ncbi:hypothetical protein KP509_07G021200 [Ceratopteris richardii]|uniref:Uncharacterized protein n=1 Tax=Ceratopteris richardii TaxID=49495 RepID=A0A8T2UJ83_CERRI|nr:hypothetical protein KP509_07G021200 [Ceratopteris richardii]